MLGLRRRVPRTAAWLVFAVCLGAFPAACALQSTDALALVSSVRSGSWSDAGTWNGHVPRATDQVAVSPGHTVTFDLAATRVSGVHVQRDAVLTFDPSRTATLESNANVIVKGRLAMKPNDPAVDHRLRFVDVDESRFVGGGMDPLDSDVGLWVMGAGQLDLVGSPKTGWTRVAGGLPAGATSASLRPAPEGWQPGDEITIVPTEAPSVGAASWNGFDEAMLVTAEDADISFDRPTAHAHPRVNGTWTAEVANLTRNVRIEGTAAHRAHVFIRSTKPQTIRYTTIRHMGARKDANGDGHTDPIPGRYALHFHHCFDGSRGSLVEGTVIRDIGNNGYAPHNSHGITFRGDVGYNINGNGLWWDDPTPTDSLNEVIPQLSHDIVVEGTLIGRLSPIPESDGGGGFPAAFVAAPGERNVMRGNVAVGVVGEINSAGYVWRETEGDRAVWVFEDNVAHNNKINGSWVWQVTSWVHPISRYLAYHNGGFGVFQGSYGAHYQWRDSVLYGNAEGQFLVWAPGDSHGAQFRIDHVVMDAAGQSDYALILPGRTIAGDRSLVTRSTFGGYRKAGVKWSHDFHDYGPQQASWELRNNRWLDPDDGKDFYVGPDDVPVDMTVHPDAILTVVDTRHGHIELRRSDQTGTYHEPWNARVTKRGPAPSDVTHPTVRVTSPVDGQKVPDDVTMTADAGDDDRVVKVEFYVDGEREVPTDRRGPSIAIDTEPPYSASWNLVDSYFPYGPRKPRGLHSFTAVAYDAAGNSESHTTFGSNNPELPEPGQRRGVG
jgi:hypothetical protein